MSLQYIIDAYNLINHPRFRPQKQSINIQYSLADFIRFNKLSGSKNNEVILVFDGYPPAGREIPEEANLTCVFSQKKEADELIKKIVENSSQPRNIIVVTDDKEVQIMSKFLHARVSSVEEFICGKENKKIICAKISDAGDLKLTYSAMQKINAELKKKWLG
ncbi:MAG: NYN domain-containing protein [Candidatus Omnitrophica bacterium]|nr:NYN domain-containing protein [Candidatus Omnitrophota bacterium]